MIWRWFWDSQCWLVQPLECCCVWIVCNASYILYVYIGLSSRTNSTREMDSNSPILVSPTASKNISQQDFDLWSNQIIIYKIIPTMDSRGWFAAIDRPWETILLSIYFIWYLLSIAITQPPQHFLRYFWFGDFCHKSPIFIVNLNILQFNCFLLEVLALIMERNFAEFL